MGNKCPMNQRWKRADDDEWDTAVKTFTCASLWDCFVVDWSGCDSNSGHGGPGPFLGVSAIWTASGWDEMMVWTPEKGRIQNVSFCCVVTNEIRHADGPSRRFWDNLLRVIKKQVRHINKNKLERRLAACFYAQCAVSSWVIRIRAWLERSMESKCCI